MNTFKKNGGFTLVELIIVIAILAILSTGAIAGYSAYIKSANTATVEANLNDVYTAAVLANAKAGSISKIEVTDASGTWTIKVYASNWDEDTKSGFDTMFEAALNATGKGDFKKETSGEGESAVTKITHYEITVSSKANWGSSDYASKTAKWENGEWTAVAGTNN